MCFAQGFDVKGFRTKLSLQRLTWRPSKFCSRHAGINAVEPTKKPFNIQEAKLAQDTKQ